MPRYARRWAPVGLGGVDGPEVDFPIPPHHQDARLVFGLLGKAKRRGGWRLYLALDFSEYLDFKENDVIRFERLTPKESRVGGSVLWLRQDANIVHHRTGSHEARAEFLRGKISDKFLPDASPSRGSFGPFGAAAFVAGGCHTGGDFDTLCAACTAVPTALIARRLRGPV